MLNCFPLLYISDMLDTTKTCWYFYNTIREEDSIIDFNTNIAFKIKCVSITQSHGEIHVREQQQGGYFFSTYFPSSAWYPTEKALHPGWESVG